MGGYWGGAVSALGVPSLPHTLLKTILSARAARRLDNSTRSGVIAEVTGLKLTNGGEDAIR